MFGIFIGTICLIALIYVIRRGRGWRRYAYGGGCGARDRSGPRGPRRYGYGPHSYLHWLFDRLDTMPGQEKQIRAAIQEFFAVARRERTNLRKSRGGVAQAMRKREFDAGAVDAAFAPGTNAVDVLRKTAIDAMAKVHAALDDKQRERLADLVESGPGWLGQWA